MSNTSKTDRYIAAASLGTNTKSLNTDIVPVERMDKVLAVGREYTKGYNYNEIAQRLELAKSEVMKCVEDYKALVRWSAQNNSNIVDRIKMIVEEVDDHYREIIKEAWKNQEAAKMADSYSNVNAALKLIADIEKLRVAMFNDIAGDADEALIAQLEEQDRKQQQIISILKELKDKFPQAAAYVRSRIVELTEEPVEIEVIE